MTWEEFCAIKEYLKAEGGMAELNRIGSIFHASKGQLLDAGFSVKVRDASVAKDKQKFDVTYEEPTQWWLNRWKDV